MFRHAFHPVCFCVCCCVSVLLGTHSAKGKEKHFLSQYGLFHYVVRLNNKLSLSVAKTGTFSGHTWTGAIAP